jgi:hypothetical protein
MGFQTILQIRAPSLPLRTVATLALVVTSLICMSYMYAWPIGRQQFVAADSFSKSSQQDDIRHISVNGNVGLEATMEKHFFDPHNHQTGVLPPMGWILQTSTKWTCCEEEYEGAGPSWRIVAPQYELGEFDDDDESESQRAKAELTHRSSAECLTPKPMYLCLEKKASYRTTVGQELMRPGPGVLLGQELVDQFVIRHGNKWSAAKAALLSESSRSVCPVEFVRDDDAHASTYDMERFSGTRNRLGPPASAARGAAAANLAIPQNAEGRCVGPARICQNPGGEGRSVQNEIACEKLQKPNCKWVPFSKLKGRKRFPGSVSYDSPDAVGTTDDDLFLYQWLARGTMCGMDKTKFKKMDEIKNILPILEHLKRDLYEAARSILRPSMKAEAKMKELTDPGTVQIFADGTAMYDTVSQCLTDEALLQFPIHEREMRTKNVVDALLTASGIIDYMSAYGGVAIFQNFGRRFKPEGNQEAEAMREVDSYRYTAQDLMDEGISYVQMSQTYHKIPHDEPDAQAKNSDRQYALYAIFVEGLHHLRDIRKTSLVVDWMPMHQSCISSREVVGEGLATSHEQACQGSWLQYQKKEGQLPKCIRPKAENGWDGSPGKGWPEFCATTTAIPGACGDKTEIGGQMVNAWDAEVAGMYNHPNIIRFEDLLKFSWVAGFDMANAEYLCYGTDAKTTDAREGECGAGKKAGKSSTTVVLDALIRSAAVASHKRHRKLTVHLHVAEGYPMFDVSLQVAIAFAHRHFCCLHPLRATHYVLSARWASRACV